MLTVITIYRMLSIIRDELGLGRQPRIAKLLVDELFEDDK